MSTNLNPRTNPGQAMIYQIRIEGHLGCEWTDWFGGLSVTLEEDGDTLLTGPVIDQAALYGLLKKVRDLGMPLVSVTQVQFNETHPYHSKKEYKVNSLNKTARIAGVLMLMIVVLAPFSMLYIPSTLIVPGDAARTANHIVASEGLFRLGIVSDSIVFLIEVVLTALLYVLLKPVNKTLSLVAAFSRLAMAVIQGINLLNYFFVLLLVSGATYLAVLATDQLHVLVLLFLNAHESVVLVWGLFFSLHLFVSGYLVYKSGYLPKILGVLLIIVSLCYLTQSFGNILLPQYKAIFTSVGSLSMIEIAFPLWLLIKGVNVERLEKRALESA